MDRTHINDEFERQQTAYIKWRRGERVNDADARLFARLAGGLPQPTFPPNFTARVVQQHRVRAQETVQLARLLSILAVVAVALLFALAVLLARPMMAIGTWSALAHTLTESHAFGSVLACGIAAVLARWWPSRVRRALRTG